ncbi:MAG: hypothetical protein U0736_03150 [Gemmataceae bacterium]
MCAVVVLLTVAIVVHGHSLRVGFWLDDHNHLELCQAHGFRDLTAGNVFDWNHRLIHVWWAGEEIGWAYFRPLPVALRTAQLHLFGLNPLPFHLVHLGLFLLTLGLFYGLLRRCGLGTPTAAVAVLFFLLHPANVFVVGWLGCDCSLLVGLWLVLGLWATVASGERGHRHPLGLAAMLGCYALALASRENGVMVGPILILFDVMRTAARPTPIGRGRRALVYLAILLTLAAYFVVRKVTLPPAPLPQAPYFNWPTDPGFLAWLPFKVLNDLVCLPFGLPFVPIVEVGWWRARPVTAMAAGLVAAGLFALVLADRTRWRIVAAVVVGTLLAKAPTVLAFSSPYNYYLASAGWAVVLALAVERWRAAGRRWPLAVPAGLAVVYLAGQWSGAWMLHSVAGSEREVRQAVLATNPRAYPPGARLFFLNLPFFAAEVAPSVRLAAGRDDLQVYPLTFAPELFASRGSVEVVQEDERTLRVRAVGTTWFAGALGEQIQLAWFAGRRDRLISGPYRQSPAAGPLPFTVEILEVTEAGVSSLRFVFDRPLADPANHFFVGSSTGWAQPIALRRPGESPVLVQQLTSPAEVDWRRLRRMQSAYDRAMNVLARWPL